MQLLTALATNPEEQTRAIAAVLLRRVLHRHNAELWSTAYDAATQKTLKDNLLAALSVEPVGHLRHKLAHTIAELAVYAAGTSSEDWPDLLPKIFSLAQHGDDKMRETALYLFTTIAEAAAMKLLVPHAAQLKPVLVRLLTDAKDAVRVQALRGAIALITSITDNALRDSFQEATPLMIQVLSAACKEDEQLARDALDSLTGLVFSYPQFIRPFIDVSITTMIAITNDEELDET